MFFVFSNEKIIALTHRPVSIHIKVPLKFTNVLLLATSSDPRFIHLLISFPDCIYDVLRFLF